MWRVNNGLATVYIDRVVVCLFIYRFYFRSVVFEAITFHKQSSELLQSAKTEKRIAEKERRDAEKNSENLSNLIAKLQQST